MHALRDGDRGYAFRLRGPGNQRLAPVRLDRVPGERRAPRADLARRLRHAQARSRRIPVGGARRLPLADGRRARGVPRSRRRRRDRGSHARARRKALRGRASAGESVMRRYGLLLGAALAVALVLGLVARLPFRAARIEATPAPPAEVSLALVIV